MIPNRRINVLSIAMSSFEHRNKSDITGLERQMDISNDQDLRYKQKFMPPKTAMKNELSLSPDSRLWHSGLSKAEVCKQLKESTNSQDDKTGHTKKVLDGVFDIESHF